MRNALECDPNFSSSRSHGDLTHSYGLHQYSRPLFKTRLTVTQSIDSYEEVPFKKRPEVELFSKIVIRSRTYILLAYVLGTNHTQGKVCRVLMDSFKTRGDFSTKGRLERESDQ